MHSLVEIMLFATQFSPTLNFSEFSIVPVGFDYVNGRRPSVTDFLGLW